MSHILRLTKPLFRQCQLPRAVLNNAPIPTLSFRARQVNNVKHNMMQLNKTPITLLIKSLKLRPATNIMVNTNKLSYKLQHRTLSTKSTPNNDRNIATLCIRIIVRFASYLLILSYFVIGICISFACCYYAEDFRGFILAALTWPIHIIIFLLGMLGDLIDKFETFLTIKLRHKSNVHHTENPPKHDNDDNNLKK